MTDKKPKFARCVVCGDTANQAFEQGKLAGINAFRERLMADIQDNPTDEVEWRDGFTTMWDWVEIHAEELGAEHIEYTDWVNERLKSQLKEAKKDV